MRHNRSSTPGSWVSAFWFSLCLAFVACGDPDDGDSPYQPTPAAPATTGDAQLPAGGGDAGIATPVSPSDAGAAPPAVGSDAQIRDPQTTSDASGLDAQLPGVDATLPPVEAGISDAGGGAEAAVPRMDLGMGTGKDVITIGDSWMLLIFTGIQESLVKASGNRPYRKYGVPGTRLLDGVIPGQFTSAKRADPNIKTVVMTGGGNDIIQNATLKADCDRGGPMCAAQLEKIGMALTELWAQMSKDGVQDVVHVMYSASAGTAMFDRAENNRKLGEACAAVPPPLRCHLLNTDALITKADMRSDGIHPTDPGYDKIGKAVWDLMVKEGMRR
jgi:lysophospholipase L1-like esterase